MKSPRPKPKPAPAIEPHSSPTEATSSGERSAATPKTATWEIVVSCRIPPTSAIATSRPMLLAFQVIASRSRRRGCAQVGVGLGQHLHEVEVAQVGERRHVDRAVELALAVD